MCLDTYGNDTGGEGVGQGVMLALGGHLLVYSVNVRQNAPFNPTANKHLINSLSQRQTIAIWWEITQLI